MENHVFILHEKVPVQRPGLQEIAGTYIPAHQVRQFQPLGFSENLLPISITIEILWEFQRHHVSSSAQVEKGLNDKFGVLQGTGNGGDMENRT